MKKTAPCTPTAVVEHDGFLALFSHRYDYIWAAHPEGAARPAWQTESRHFLSDRLLLQSAYLYGVRFGPTTQYIMLDVDRGSLYHPANDPLALDRIYAALEPLGLMASLTCSSSYSGGLHIYFPFAQPQKTWEIALIVTTLLTNSGCRPAPGHLEVFPNPRTFSTEEKPTLYQAHRLPLQTGSYLLNEQYEAVSASKDLFVARWQRCQTKNDLDQLTLKQILKASKRHSYRITHKAEKFLNDLNSEIERGWTGPGMTNRLLGRITMRSYIFGHILNAAQPLAGEALVQDIIKTARALPGFYDWSNHVHEIDKRAQDWAAAIERTERYYPYGTARPVPKAVSDAPASYHTQVAKQARERVRVAIATLLNEGQLPGKVSERFKLLSSRFHIGGSTLYKHKDLWHPAHLTPAHLTNATPPVENPPDPPTKIADAGLACYEEAARPAWPPSLLAGASRNMPSDKDLQATVPTAAKGERCNSHASPAEGQLVLQEVFQALEAVQAQQQWVRKVEIEQRAAQQQQRAESMQAAYIARMRQYLASNDPILMAEALQWLQAHPERLDEVL